MKIASKTKLFIFITFIVSFSYQFEDFGILNALSHKKPNKIVSNSTIIEFKNSTNSTNPQNSSSIPENQMSN